MSLVCLGDRNMNRIIIFIVIAFLLIVAGIIVDNGAIYICYGIVSLLVGLEKQIEDSQKLTEGLEEESEAVPEQGENQEADIDHSFAKRVANEIVKNNANLLRMDEGIKGHKQLTRSMKKMEQILNANGYELLDMLNKPYNEGMNVIATFIPDDTLNEGEEIITRIIKPHITYKGKIIQAAEIQVSQG